MIADDKAESEDELDLIVKQKAVKRQKSSEKEKNKVVKQPKSPEFNNNDYLKKRDNSKKLKAKQMIMESDNEDGPIKDNKEEEESSMEI